MYVLVTAPPAVNSYAKCTCVIIMSVLQTIMLRKLYIYLVNVGWYCSCVVVSRLQAA